MKKQILTGRSVKAIPVERDSVSVRGAKTSIFYFSTRGEGNRVHGVCMETWFLKKTCIIRARDFRFVPHDSSGLTNAELPGKG